MKKLLFILPLLIWVSCEDENAGDEPLIAGIYESRFYYDDSQGLYIEEDPTWGYWEKISKKDIFSRFSVYTNTDSACYSDWDASDGDWEIIGEDSATLTYYFESLDLYDVWAYKLVEDTLYSYNISIDGEVIFPIGKSIRADSHDFSLSPLCNFSDLFGGG